LEGRWARLAVRASRLNQIDYSVTGEHINFESVYREHLILNDLNREMLDQVDGALAGSLSSNIDLLKNIYDKMFKRNFPWVESKNSGTSNLDYDKIYEKIMKDVNNGK